MRQPVRVLNESNIDNLISAFQVEVKHIGTSISGLTGVDLLTALKRKNLGHGPYPDVTLFEAANRIMSDLVILYGVRGLLNARTFPFSEYTVEFGNEDNNGFDIRAASAEQTLVGEAFNVAPSYLQGKKGAALKKLRAKGSQATYKLVMFNADAVHAAYAGRTEAGEYHVIVDITTGKVEVVPSPAPEKAAA